MSRLISFKLLWAIGVVLLTGCGSKPVGIPVFPVSGKVLVNGQPAKRAQVTFHPVTPTLDGATVRPFAVVEADGSFRPSTQLTADGAPAGEYKVTIVWPEIRVDQGEEVEGPDRLAGAYNAFNASQLNVTVQPGDNQLPPFELKTP